MIIVERASTLIVGGVDRTYAIKAARRLCKQRNAIFRVRDTTTGAVLYTARPESNERRKACNCPPKCWGPKREQHSIKCRPARPACRWQRKAQGFQVCDCPAYKFPHRAKGGRCNPEQATAALWGPMQEAS